MKTAIDARLAKLEAHQPRKGRQHVLLVTGEYDADEGVPGAPPMRLLVADHVRMCAEGV